MRMLDARIEWNRRSTKFVPEDDELRNREHVRSYGPKCHLHVKGCDATVQVMRRLLPFALASVLVKAAPHAKAVTMAGLKLPNGKKRSSFHGPSNAALHYDQRLLHAAKIAHSKAHSRSTSYCWRYVKNALVSSGAVDSRPTTRYAKQAGTELCQHYGFRKLDIKDPYSAPVGAVLVYGGSHTGHVEIRTENGFVSDFYTTRAHTRPLIGIYVKPA